jgi:CPA2 family monovalent cation:H+ antiporter-2
LLWGAPGNADVTAIDYCQLLVLERRDFLDFIERHPELRAKIGTIATEREAQNRQATPPIDDVQGA